MSSQTSVYRTAIATHVDAHDRWPALFDVHGELDDETFWTIVRDFITQGLFFHPHEEIIRRVLTAERINAIERLEWAFTQEDRDYWKRALGRKKPIKVYRGGAKPNLTGFAWTRDKDRAVSFAVASGHTNATLVTGYLEPANVLMVNAPKGDIFAFAEQIKVREVFGVVGLSGQSLQEQRIRIGVATVGANGVINLTPAEYFSTGIKEGNLDKTVVVNSLSASRKLLEPLGFKTRVAQIDSILEAIG